MAYQHQEYPKMLHRPDGTYLIVQNEQEKEAALEDGWNLKPGAVAKVSPEPERDSEEETEAEKPKRGRPPKKG